MIVNLGKGSLARSNPHPLSAPPGACEWKVIINSEDQLWGKQHFPLKMKGIVAIPGMLLFVGTQERRRRKVK